MKINFKLSTKPPFIICVGDKDLAVIDGHWSDEYEKAVYTIKKTTNDNGYCNYKPYRTLNGETKHVSMSCKFGYKTKKEALEAIAGCKAFYREAWNAQYTHTVEWLVE